MDKTASILAAKMLNHLMQIFLTFLVECQFQKVFKRKQFDNKKFIKIPTLVNIVFLNNNFAFAGPGMKFLQAL